MNQPQGSLRAWLNSRAGLVTAIFLGAIAFLIATGHGAHLLGAAPYLLLFACPAMHLFMHGNHGHHDHDRSRGPDKREDKP